ncbi:MAG: helix-turn-helix transcriptional regulator [Spirochaetaceae bacterium]|nr:helix-turn-helix transcriptional regulator [Spirochaetaceae bacterium]
MNNQDKEILKKLGSKLKEYRLINHISQEKFAELTELDRTYISGLERGLRNPSFLIIKRLTSVLNISPNDLFMESK